MMFLRVDLGTVEANREPKMNAINVIAPYKYHGQWVFDDPRVGLAQEPFVAGADTWIDHVLFRGSRHGRLAVSGAFQIFHGRPKNALCADQSAELDSLHRGNQLRTRPP